jgi:hypothetical protein
MHINREKERGECADCVSAKQTFRYQLSNSIVRDLISEAGEHGAPAVGIVLVSFIHARQISHW